MRRPERQPTILLVDDHRSLRFDVLTAGTGEKAMAYCEGFDGPIDLLLTDVGLTLPVLWPGEGTDSSIRHGVALATRALQIRPALKGVLLTGDSRDRLKRLGAATERFVLIQKPCDLPTLVTTFRQLLQEGSLDLTPAPPLPNDLGPSR